MDEEPFLTFDLETVSRAGISDEVIDALIYLTKANFNPETVAEVAHVDEEAASRVLGRGVWQSIRGLL